MFAGLAPAAAAPAAPDLGPNVKIFGPTTSVAKINAYLQGIAGEEQFSTGRHLVLFRPGTYGSAGRSHQLDLGYYTAVAGPGLFPEDVVINGALHVDPDAAVRPQRA